MDNKSTIRTTIDPTEPPISAIRSLRKVGETSVDYPGQPPEEFASSLAAECVIDHIVEAVAKIKH